MLIQKAKPGHRKDQHLHITLSYLGRLLYRLDSAEPTAALTGALGTKGDDSVSVRVRGTVSEHDKLMPNQYDSSGLYSHTSYKQWQEITIPPQLLTDVHAVSDGRVFTKLRVQNERARQGFI